MPLLLHIETATQVCSVALSENNSLLAIQESNDKSVHSKKLTVFIENLMNETGRKMSELEAVVVSKGPGSYTGLRIGVSVAKGICYALNIPLISVSTLQALACGFVKEHNVPDEAMLCPMIDARRMEVYTAFYNVRCVKMKEVTADIIEADSYAETLDKQEIYFFGDGADKCKETIKHPSAKFISGINPSAQNMIKLGTEKYKKQQFENTAYFEPFYLKDFIATIPKKNIYK